MCAESTSRFSALETASNDEDSDQGQDQGPSGSAADSGDVCASASQCVTCGLCNAKGSLCGRGAVAAVQKCGSVAEVRGALFGLCRRAAWMSGEPKRVFGWAFGFGFGPIKISQWTAGPLPRKFLGMARSSMGRMHRRPNKALSCAALPMHFSFPCVTAVPSVLIGL